MKAIDIDVRIGIADLWRAQVSIALRKLAVILIMCLGLMGIGVCAVIYSLAAGRSIEWFLTDTLRVALVPLAITVVVMVSAYFGSRRELRNSASLREVNHFSFGSEGVRSNSAVSSINLAWDDLYEVRETWTAFHIFQSDLIMILIPKKAFFDADQMQAFRQVVRSHMGKRAVLRSG